LKKKAPSGHKELTPRGTLGQLLDCAVKFRRRVYPKGSNRNE
jgi:hypothetical protein